MSEVTWFHYFIKVNCNFIKLSFYIKLIILRQVLGFVDDEDNNIFEPVSFFGIFCESILNKTR